MKKKSAHKIPAMTKTEASDKDAMIQLVKRGMERQDVANNILNKTAVYFTQALD